ncbi:MAG TPA: hypothetical protein EYP89_03235 [Candidatus Omnitrophica bacterium]|nr:hypothetical protein [Candidatus Omnitrophota bacterium]
MRDFLFIIYDIIFILGLFLYFPIYFLRKKINFYAIKAKLGFLSLVKNKNCLWIQVVSVGEVNLIARLVSEWRKIKRIPIVISTTTLTGYQIARDKYSLFCEIIYFPFDLSFVLKKVIKKIKPKIFVAVETEIWPNLFYQLKKRNIPIVIINGRISQKSFLRYKLIKPITKSVLRNCDYIGVQNSFYKKRFISLGAEKEKIFISGNMKFESIQVDKERLKEIEEKFSFLKEKLLFVAGSTHYPEEEIIVEIYKNIADAKENINLLVAPRHIQRVPNIEKIILSYGFTPVRISKLTKVVGEKSIFLLDTIGQLLYFYSFCDFCFVGGSLTKFGGHNILEPIYFGKPTCFGPFMDNFKDVEKVVLDKGAAIKVKNKEELQKVILVLIKDKILREKLRARCKEVFEEERKSLKINLEIISRCIKV